MNEFLKNHLLEIDYLHSVANQLSWDESTQMPVKAAPLRSNIHAYIGSLLQQKSTDSEFLKQIQDLSQQKNLSLTEKATIREIQKKHHYYSAKNPEFYQELSKSFSEGFQAWEEARNKNDFSIYAPKLEKNISLTKELAKSLGDFDTPYDALLNIYEEGLTTTYLDKIFDPLKTEVIKLMSNLPKQNPSLPQGSYPNAQQKEMAIELLKMIHFDLDKGVLAESTHPMTNTTQPNDVRLTVNYNEKDFTEVFFALLHEGGHGLYEQNIQESLYGTGLCSGTAMSIHESCSRMFENQVGRSQEFLDYYYPNLVKFFPNLKQITSKELYQIANHCEASLIRIHADEISYNLHIIIRYEIEKMVINNDISVYDLPSIWNQKYQEYLGITPKNDKEGIMQDIHWSCIMMGYFPSYALGSIYATQLFNTFKKQHTINYKGQTLTELVQWMKENVYQYGSLYTPNELIQRITGDDLNIAPYIEYLKGKVSV